MDCREKFKIEVRMSGLLYRIYSNKRMLLEYDLIF